MPRRHRLSLPNVPMHVIQRGHDRQAYLFTNDDYLCYLDWLKLYAGQTSCQILASPHSVGSDAATRQEAYSELFAYDMDSSVLDGIRKATNVNFALGNSRFGDEIAKLLGARTMPGKSWRPRRIAVPVAGELL